MDIFINKINEFEDKLNIFCNAQEPKIEMSISDSKCSPMELGWWRRRESNSRPYGCEPYALPTELRPQNSAFFQQAKFIFP